jgi:ferredoxin
MKIKIRVDEGLCIGAASCVAVAPATYQLNDENKAIVLDKSGADTEQKYERWLEVSPEEYDRILLGAQSCPTLAIYIYDENEKQIFPEI